MFTKYEIESLDHIVYSAVGRNLEEEGYKVRVDDKGQIIVSHKDNLMPDITFQTFVDANDDVSFFADMKFDAFFDAESDNVDVISWYVNRWLKVTKAVEKFEKQVFTL